VLGKCPGSGNIRTPVPSLKKCPECGEEAEIWSDELRVKCTRCGATVLKENVPSCVEWCPSAKACIGEEKYTRLNRRKDKIRLT
jgi:DNA-directed RNA polymerase subunit RPC12/RpoP